MDQEKSANKWVLLVAGSKDWKNYRHQANVCCAYQIIKEHGIPDDNIVVMMYDDIAYNKDNPIKGNITSVITDIKNVYTGVPKDYTGDDVTPSNFLAALQGDDRTQKKVIISGRNNQIFVYMSSLGDEGTFGFPGQNLDAADLIGAINSMHHDKKFSKMVIYMDSDKSKSMFKDLSPLKNVYAVTSSDEKAKNQPNNYDTIRKVYLSDEFSSAWLTFINGNDTSSATLENLFDFITNTVQKPQVLPCKFGDMKIGENTLSEFL
ncbi:hypothetical protein ABG768_005025 [Culter alburnus]|uniref:Legumain n=1 Tax=Culter alburnus TaxID=194366 RepID=A0AAW1ZZR1_CULAL